MKLFLDRNKTLLPRIDYIFLLTRIMTLVGIIWFALYDNNIEIENWFFEAVIATYAAQLILFYAGFRGKFNLKLGYLTAIIYDLFFIPLFIHLTGFHESSFFLLYFLTASVAAYVLTFWFATAVTAICSLSYIVLFYRGLTLDNLFDFIMRIGFLWAYFLFLSYASEYLRRSERRILKLFDTLNLRTSELEKSQAQLEIIYENTRILAAILDADNVVKEVMRIMENTLQYNNYAMIFLDKRSKFYYRARSIEGHNNFHLKAIDMTGMELVQKASEMQESLRLKDIRGRDDYLPLNDKAHSVMIVPMTAHGQAHGLLLAESVEKNYFFDRDIQLLSIVARSAALALENAELHKRAEELTVIDELTETYNYRYFVQKLQEEKKRAYRYNLPLSLIMVDIDWFKKINDSYGHEVGNVVLKELSDVIKSCIRDVDIFCRYGGEEFMVILPQTAQVEASRIGERIREKVEEMVVDAGDDRCLKITVSVGVTSYPENGKSHEDLVSVADQALYRAKGSGKNLVCII